MSDWRAMSPPRAARELVAPALARLYYVAGDPTTDAKTLRSALYGALALLRMLYAVSRLGK